MSELTFIEEGNPTFLPGHPGVINFHKYRLYAKALRGIQRHQQVAYVIGVLKVSATPRLPAGFIFSVVYSPCISTLKI